MQEVILAMPRKYRALKNNLKFYAGTDAFQGIVKNNGTLADAIAEALGAGQGSTGSTQSNTQSYLDGVGQTFGVLAPPVSSVWTSWRFPTTQLAMST
jgi:hypothetical protein